MHQVTALSNGLRIVTLNIPRVESVSVGIWVGIGGRYEPAQLSGISHFIEHLLFKGTRRHTALQLSEAVERVGGSMNAFTSEESTCFYAHITSDQFPRILDILADMYLHPLFAPSDIEKERGVIRDEIMMYRDQPAQVVHETLGQMLWPRHPLGRPITGSVETVSVLRRDDLWNYKTANYLPANTVISVAGKCGHLDVVEAVEEQFQNFFSRGRSPRFAPVRKSNRRTHICLQMKETEQTHLAMGVLGVSRYHLDRFAVRLLSIILGENMSSRLFQIIREQHGLVYSIQTSTAFYADTGAFVISAGLDHRHLQKVLRLLRREIVRVIEKSVTQTELDNAKNYALGQLKLGQESTSNQMMWAGEYLLSFGKIFELPDIIRQTQAVTVEDVRRVASSMLSLSKWQIAVVGPEKDSEKISAAWH